MHSLAPRGLALVVRHNGLHERSLLQSSTSLQRCRKIHGSTIISKRVAKLLQGVLASKALSAAGAGSVGAAAGASAPAAATATAGNSRPATVADVIDLVKSIGRVLAAAEPQAPVIANVIRRALFLIREEAARPLSASSLIRGVSGSSGDSGTVSGGSAVLFAAGGGPRLASTISSDSGGGGSLILARSVSNTSSRSSVAEVRAAAAQALAAELRRSINASPEAPSAAAHGANGVEVRSSSKQASAAASGSDAYATVPYAIIQEGVEDGIAELLDELDNLDASLAVFAHDHIRSGDCVLTVGNSSTAVHFLLAAAEKVSSS